MRSKDIGEGTDGEAEADTASSDETELEGADVAEAGVWLVGVGVLIDPPDVTDAESHKACEEDGKDG